MTEATRGIAREKALEYVKHRVLTGEFPGGELISEGTIAAALGLSRTPVREAFLRLEAAGLLRLYPQRGALVVPVSAAEISAVIEARLVIEIFAACKIIEAGSEIRITVGEKLHAQLARQREALATSNTREFLEADRAFHCVMVDCVGNPILTDFYSSLRDRQLRMIAASIAKDKDRSHRILQEHQAIAAAITNGDLESARQQIESHLQGTREALCLS